LILVVVYVGAVMTLFLFIVMMLHVNIAAERKGYVRYLPFALLIAVLVLGFSIMAVGPSQFGLTHLLPPAMQGADYNNIAVLGRVLYTDYVYPFEIAAVLLLTAIVAAISLSHRSPRARKVQRVSEQIAVRREECVKLVKMVSEKKNPSKGALN
jgi:NADH-quinone oxidoreductase subunit J